jgi:TonB family protein
VSDQRTKKKLPFLTFTLIFAVAVAAQTDQSKVKLNRAADTKPKAFYTPSPEYTDSARHDKIQGTSILAVDVDSEGHPHGMSVLKSLRPDLDEKAKEAVSKWRFLPATKDGKPVPFTLSVELDFHLPQK